MLPNYLQCSHKAIIGSYILDARYLEAAAIRQICTENELRNLGYIAPELWCVVEKIGDKWFPIQP